MNDIEQKASDDAVMDWKSDNIHNGEERLSTFQNDWNQEDREEYIDVYNDMIRFLLDQAR